MHREKFDRAAVISGTPAVYPYWARVHRITGKGVAVMKIDPATGKVTSCYMAISTGSALLDDAALTSFRTFRFKPGGAPAVKCPIDFTLSPAGTEEFSGFYVRAKPTDEALAPFLGKGTVEEGPMPAYPRSVPWTDKHGKGIYEIHVKKDGTVSDVKILTRSGDDVFDRAAVDTLRQWHLHRGPLIIELPLVFNLTPTHYSVGVPKKR
jgi:TonB family protein